MGLVYTRTGGGLVVAEHGQDEAAAARTLREYDPELRLVRQYDDVRRTPVWKVYSYRGPDQPAVFLLAWTDDRGVPLPLSSRLLDKVKELDRNSRAAHVDEDVLNARKREREARQLEQDMQDLADDWRTREGRSAVLHRGVHLRRSRSKTGLS